jgi:hypothetical protein
LDQYWCLICDKVRRAGKESYDPCVHVTVFNVAVFDRGDENSLEALMQSAQGGDAAAYTRLYKYAATGCDNELVLSIKTGYSRHEGYTRWVLSDESQ